jgi:hypothetical protein
MTQCQVERDEPAGRMPEYDGSADAQQRAQLRHIVGHLLQGAGLRRRAAGPALAAQVNEGGRRTRRPQT